MSKQIPINLKALKLRILDDIANGTKITRDDQKLLETIDDLIARNAEVTVKITPK